MRKIAIKNSKKQAKSFIDLFKRTYKWVTFFIYRYQDL